MHHGSVSGNGAEETVAFAEAIEEGKALIARYRLEEGLPHF